MQRMSTVITPWLVWSAAGFFALWLILLFCRMKAFARMSAWFNALTPLRKIVAVAAICLFTMWGGSKEGGDRGGGGYGGYGDRALPGESGGLCSLPPELAAESNLLSITAFEVDPSNRAVAFEAMWNSNLFDYADSRSFYLFSSTNLQEQKWTPLGAFLMPSDTNACAFAVMTNDVDSVALPFFLDSFNGIGFYRFGVDFDSDGDGLIDSYETLWTLTDPDSPDTDGDGLTDGQELSPEVGTSPLLSDTDGDGISDGDEIAVGTNPCSFDSDGDGLLDREELGDWEYGDSGLPVFDVSGGTNLLVSSKSYISSVFAVPLPFDVMCAGLLHTNLTVGINGLVGLISTRSSQAFSAGYVNYNLSSQSLSQHHTAVAAYWDDLYAAKNGGSQITVADVTTNGQRYCVIEYSCIQQYSLRTNTLERGTFQIAIPQAETNVIYVHYIDMSPAFDGSSASIGAQLPKRQRNFAVAHNTAGAVTNGMVLAYRFGTGTNPLEPDSDGDGLDDGDELSVGTCPWMPDTDGDGLKDGWEVLYGIDPLSTSGDDGADGDPDGDSLRNLKEQEYETSPILPDTDGDGLSDAEETGSIAVATNSIPWLSFDGYEDLTTELSASSKRCVNIGLASPLHVQHVMVTNLTISYRGILFLDRAGYANVGNGTGSEAFDRHVDRNAFVIAPCLGYHNLYTNLSERSSSIRVGTATYGGEGYLLAEWSNMYDTVSSSSTNAISFQVAIPTNRADRAFVRYRDVTGPYMTGRYGSIGMQTLDGRWLHSYCYQQSGKVWSGLSLAFLFGANSDPRSNDIDLDGLSDAFEASIGTDPMQPDTDGDGMEDGWELTRGFDPVTHNSQTPRTDDDADADPDGDGLTNAEECEWGTNPSGADEDEDGTPDGYDTDGDGVGDGSEVSQSSDPSDATDLGAPNSRVPVQFHFGDPSTSQSEKYRLELEPVDGPGETPTGFSWVNANYGECETKKAMLKEGWMYSVRMSHSGTSPQYQGDPRPDYDYSLELVTSDLPPNVVISDPSGLFGGNGNSGTSFTGEGKVAYVSVCVVTNVAICNPDGSSWEELEAARVVLDDEELRIKIEIVPQITSLAQCRQAFGYFLTVKTAGTCPAGMTVLVGDDATLVNSSGKSEIRISNTRQQLIALGLLPSQNADGVNEMAWYDVGNDNLSSESNLSDSRAFAGLGYQFRGQILMPIMGNLDSDPPISINSESFYKSAGCEIVTAHFGGVDSKRRQIMNQADYFYYSGHGRHSDASLMGLEGGPRLTPSLVSSYWNRDLKCAVFAGCSVLDINDYNGNYEGTAEHTSSPGKQWASIEGPTSFLGYAYKAPRDTQGADRIVSAWVANRGSMGDVNAWMHANDNRNGRNACTVQRIDDSHVRYSYFKREKGFLYNSYFSTNVIERITQ